MNSTRWMLAACLVLAAGCKKDGAADEAPAASAPAPAEGADPSLAAAGAVAEAAPAGEGAAAATATAGELPPEEERKIASALSGAPDERPGLDAQLKAGKAAAGKDLVAVGASGQARVIATASKVLADTDTYTVSLAAPGAVTAGGEGAATVKVVPKGVWKLNDEFPTKLTVTAPAGVSVKKAEQKVKDAVSFGEKEGRWSVEFTAQSAGDKAFKGVVKFAVCTPESCIPKKEELAWNVKVE